MTSVAGVWSVKRHSGFSLVEMLIVLVVVGILYSSAGSMLNMMVSDPLSEERERLAEYISLAQDEAVVRSQALALGFGSKGYGFFQMNEQPKTKNAKQEDFVPIEHESFFSAHDLPSGYAQTLYLQGQSVGVGQLHPQIFILPTGEMTPFEWRLTFNGREEVVKFNAQGQRLDTQTVAGAK